jgi:porin
MNVGNTSKYLNHLAGALLAAGLLAGTSTAALAQAAPPAVSSNPLDFTYIGKDFGQTLKSYGVYINLGYVEDFAANVSGGANRGSVFQGELFFGTDLDLQTILGIPSTSLHITMDARNGKNWNTLMGDTGYPLSAAYGPNDQIRLAQLEWDQDLADDHVRILFGRTNPTTDFATSDVACQSVTTFYCAQTGAWYINNANEAYPQSTWGGRVTIKPTQPTYLRFGLYEDNAENLNFHHGFDWSTTGATGVFIPAEFGIQTNFATAPLPYHYNFGFWWDSTDYTGPGSGPNAVPSHSRSELYTQLQQTVWRPDPNTNRSATVFGGFFGAIGGPEFFQDTAYIGNLFRGLIPGRPDDTLFLIAEWENINKHERDTLARELGTSYPYVCGPTPLIGPSSVCQTQAGEWNFEINYGFLVAPGITFKPFMDVVINPDQGQVQYVQQLKLNIKTAYTIGAQVSINAAAALGLPHWVRTN